MSRVLLALLAGFVVTQIATLATTIYLHRALSHRSLSLAPPASFAFRVLLWMTTGIRAREWVAVHRAHHAHSDRPGDPHSPKLVGFPAVQFGNVVLYRRALAGGSLVGRYARDLAPDRWDRAVFDHGMAGLAIGIALLCVTFGLWTGLLAAGLHAGGYLLLNAAVNAVGHTFGSRPHDNVAGNNQWLAWLTSGEGLHNNHHAVPSSPRLALSARERDPGWWVIRLLVRLRLATLRQPAARPLATAAAP